MGQALYRKYRSKSLDEIVGQEHIITALKTALEKGRLSHAYLFTGPRGVGKTSVARILAHEINNLPYTEEDAHIDIIEIDAASNRGIDEIRDLREKIYIAPTTGKYKVYIIDEVHMLTPQAFNALLKTLEEPPEHVVFILATTESHKLPATIISRTQRYTFRPANQIQLVAHLRSIADKEKIKISDEALELIAEHGDGSFRDSVGLLDQVGNGKVSIGAEEVHELLGVPPATAINELIKCLASGSMRPVATQLNTLYGQGYQATILSKEIAKQLRRSLLDNKPLLATPILMGLLKNLIEVPASPDAARYLEITLLAAIMPADTYMQAPQPPKNAPTQPLTSRTILQTITNEPASIVAEAAPSKKTTEPQTTPDLISELVKPSLQGSGVVDEAVWPQVLAQLKSQYNTLYSIIRMAQPEFEPGKVRLTFAFAFHQKRLNEAKNKSIVSNVIIGICGQDVELECLFDKNAKPSSIIISPVAKPVNSSIDTVSNIFGGGELLES